MKILVKPAWRAAGARMAALAMALLVAACTVALEPQYDAGIVKELETLTADTSALFARIEDGIPVAGYEDRKDTYADLAGRAATVRLYAKTRPQPSGPVASLLGADDKGDGDDDGGDYANATAGYMNDYLRNLKMLADRDRKAVESVVGDAQSFEAARKGYLEALEHYRTAYRDWVLGEGPKPDDLADAPAAPSGGVPAAYVALRRTQIEDILTDALFYERDILNR